MNKSRKDNKPDVKLKRNVHNISYFYMLEAEWTYKRGQNAFLSHRRDNLHQKHLEWEEASKNVLPETQIDIKEIIYTQL